MRVMEQVEVQRRGGLCARYPSSCIVVGLLGDAGLLRPLQPLRVLDLTYGRGMFWAAANTVVVGFDIRILDWVVEPRCFWGKPAWAWKYYADDIEECLGGPPDLVAVDPPWSARGSSTRRYYGLDRAVGDVASILEAAREASMHYNAALLVHLKDRWVPESHVILAELYWEPLTRYMNRSRNGPYTWWGVLEPRR